MDVTAQDLVTALLPTMGRDEDEDTVDYLIDTLAEAIAMLQAALDTILKEMQQDERVLL